MIVYAFSVSSQLPGGLSPPLRHVHLVVLEDYLHKACQPLQSGRLCVWGEGGGVGGGGGGEVFLP